jgi:PKD repeat protein|tara:strand:+ start:11584 stop:11898 length:315 start_codon:yes stop_codon:yes gene_type:complete
MGLTDSTSITAPASIQFTNQSIGDEIISYDWSFGDGSHSSTISPTHVFNTAGTYTVTLVVENEAGTSTKSHNIVISNAGNGNGGTSEDDPPFDPDEDKYNGMDV